jgi:hypothetical protein
LHGAPGNGSGNFGWRRVIEAESAANGRAWLRKHTVPSLVGGCIEIGWGNCFGGE